MATYQHNEGADPFVAFWGNVDATYVSASSTLVILNNTDGSQTRLAGSGFTFTGAGSAIVLTGGTISSLSRTDGTGATTYETITSVSYAATTFQSHMSDSNLQTVMRDVFSGNDTFTGFSGGDTFGPFAGNDTLTGGGGFDNASYNFGSLITGPITVTLGPTSTVVGNASVGTDTLFSVERVSGTSFDDTFTLLAGFAGSFGNFAEFEGNRGNDTINGFGTNGTTRAAYNNASAGVFVDLANGTAHSIAPGDAANIGVDTLIGVTGVSASAFDDTLTAAGGRGQFQFFGLAGNDTIIGTLEGVSAFDFNLARYDQSNATAGIVALLGATSTVTGNANVGTDTLINVESVRGTQFIDTFTATTDFTGEFGHFNSFEGLGGNDVIHGNGVTRIEYSSALAAVTINAVTHTATSTAGGDAAGIGTDAFDNGVVSFSGSAFNDTIVGSSAAERFRGLAGNDTIDGGGNLFDNVDYRNAATPVSVDLGAGTASDGLGGTDTLINMHGARGSEFDDSLIGSAGDDLFSGHRGNDNIVGGDGNDFLVGDDDVDPWNGIFGTGNPSGLGGNDTIDAGNGNDTVYAGDANDVVFAGAGDDNVNGGNGDDVILGQNGNDTIGGDDGNDNINAGDGTDVVFGGAGNDTIGGGAGDDIIVGEDGNDVIFGEDGNDIANAGAGADVLIGGLGNDTFGGGADNDILVGGDGDDLLFGEDGVDNMNGEFGNDGIVGGSGDDILGGGAGNDIVVGDDGNDVLFGETGNDSMNGGFGNDILIGSDGDDVLGGGAGDDDINGGFGNDTLFGENGNDILNGSAGNDTFVGGGNDDTFVFQPGDGADTIADFFAGGPEDRIWFIGTDLHSFADVQAHTTFNTAAGTTTITYNGFFTVTLNAVSPTQLTSGDFIFT